MKAFLSKLAAFIRTAWMIVGVTVVMVLLIELGFRIKQKYSGELVYIYPRPEAYAKADWFGGYTYDYDQTREQRWRPFVYFRRKPNYKGKYVNIDSAGRRVTPQPSTPAVPKAKVFFFGGSTLWGDFQRDDHTIPAVASQRLQELAGPGQRIEVTNFGEGGYVSAQGVVGLMLQLRAGARPDVVVFYDGINDVVATVQAGYGGYPQNEAKRVAEFDMGRRLDRGGMARGPREDLGTFAWLAGTALQQSALSDWIKRHINRPPVEMVSADSAAKATASAYVDNARIVEALGKTYGFTPIFVWQPTLQATQKKLTPFEKRRMDQLDADPAQKRVKEVHLRVPALLDSAMAAVAPGRFVDGVALFKNDTTNVYADRIGHNVEAAIPAIVDSFWPQLKDAVTKRIAKR